MVTRLDKTLKREITVEGQPFIVLLSADGLKLTAKGRRKGLEISWRELVTGNPDLAAALHESAQGGGAGESGSADTDPSDDESEDA